MAEDVSGLIQAIRDLIQALGTQHRQGDSKDSQQMLNATLNGVQAINNLTLAIQAAFPQGNTVAASAGGSSGSYLVVTANGNSYKVQLLNP